MSDKTYVAKGEQAPCSQIGATLEALAATIHARRAAGGESYTHRLLTSSPDEVLKKVMEEAGEVALAAKDVEAARIASDEAGTAKAATDAAEVVRKGSAANAALAQQAATDAYVDHLRYEAADVAYHLMVVLERYHIPLDEFAAELNTRMTDAERPSGGVRLVDAHVKRGK